MKRGMNRSVVKAFLVFFVGLFLMGFVSAGVGIGWDKESVLSPEGSKTCLTYKVYNPWEKDAYAKIELSDELTELMSSQDSESKFIPKGTFSNESIPITFCFKVPHVYKKDCLIGNSLICKEECKEEMKVYEGTVNVVEMNKQQFLSGGTGGSKTSMSVSAPLRVRVQCIAHDRNWSVVYALIALIALILLILNINRNKRKSKKKTKKKKAKKKN